MTATPPAKAAIANGVVNAVFCLFLTGVIAVPLFQAGASTAGILWSLFGLYWTVFWFERPIKKAVAQQEHQEMMQAIRKVNGAPVQPIPTLPTTDPRLGQSRGAVVVKGSVAVNCTRCNALQNIRIGAPSFACRECKAVIPVVIQK